MKNPLPVSRRGSKAKPFRRTKGRRQAAARAGPPTARSTYLSWMMVGIVALALAGLRIHIFRLQYALGEAASIEKQLIEKERSARVRLAELRDPKRLARLADEQGFRAPEQILRVSAVTDPR